MRGQPINTFFISRVNDMTNTEPKNIGVKKKKWVVCFENTILELDLSIYEKMVYVVLCSHAKKDGPAFPSVKTIAKEASCSRTKVFEALKTLEEQGVITRDNRIFQGRGQTSNLYEIIDTVPSPQNEQGGDSNSPSPSVMRTEESATRMGESAARTGGVRDTDAHIKVLEQDYMNKTKEQNTPPTPPGEKSEGEGGKFPEEQKKHDTEQKAQGTKAAGAEFFELVLNAYNTALPELPKAEKITAPRAKILRQRIREDPARRRLSWWKQFFSGVRGFPWPMGDNPSNWRANFDWLIGEKGMQKILEGGFGRTSGPNLGKGTKADWELQKKHTDEGGRIDGKAILREIQASQARR
jgi:predicted transcriptional regulator